MKILRLSAVIFAYSAVALAQAHPDTRFDGTWVGKETAIPPPKMGSGYDSFVPLPKKVTVIVAQGGALVGYLGGNCLGRYDNVQRAGNTLSFGAGDCKLTLRLSQDGKTLTEEGSCMIPVQTAHTLYHGSYPSIVMPLQLRATLQHSSK